MKDITVSIKKYLFFSNGYRMFFLLLNCIYSFRSDFVGEGQQFELYDAKNSEYLLAARGNQLFFITTSQAKIQSADTVFTLENKRLRLGTKDVCDYGVSGRELWLCEYVKSYSTWTLEPIPFEYEMYTIREWSGKKCAVYGDMLPDNERKLEVGPCQGDVAKFKTVYINEFVTKTPSNNSYSGLNVYPYRQMLPKKTFEPFLSDIQTLNV